MTHKIRYFDDGQREVHKSPEAYITANVPTAMDETTREYLMECLQELHEACALAGKGDEDVLNWLSYIRTDHTNWDVHMHSNIQTHISEDAQVLVDKVRSTPSPREVEKEIETENRNTRQSLYDDIAKGGRMSKKMPGRRVA